MGFRKCEKHGWLETSEYTVDEIGETICPICRTPTHDWRHDGEPPHHVWPRERFIEAAREYHEEIGRV